MIRLVIPEKRKILIVDDDPFIRDLLLTILESSGYEVETAENGSDALSRFSRDQDRSLILSDMDMPGMNGLDLIREIRKIDTEVPVIILTGNSEISVALEAINQGANDYLLKDENIRDTILLSVTKVMEKHMLEMRVDALLKNTLPEVVVQEIKFKGYFEPRMYYCTILFTDFVHFTQLSESMSGQALIKTLDEIFTIFDDRIAHFKGTKIKTIGDAYMAVFGAPEEFDDHAVMAIRAAIALFQSLNAYNREHLSNFRMRIGIHTGTVMAGVVGKERMQFDVFGDDVNIASRFESAGEKGRINVSEETHMLAGSFFDFEERGYIRLKNKPDMKAFFVKIDSVKILLADEDLDLCRKLGQILENAGYSVEIVQSLLDGNLPDGDFDMILSGMQWPGGNGTGGIRELRKKWADIPLIVLVDADEIPEAFEFLRAGADGYVLKDQNIDEVIRLSVENSLETCRLRKENLRLTENLIRKSVELQRFAFLDNVTGIANRRHFNKMAGQEWRRAAREKFPIAFIVIDIDYLQLYNDVYSHENGDLCLKQIARSLDGSLKRSGDFIARYGGEEFFAVLPNTDLTGAEKVAETMRMNVNALKIAHSRSPISEFVTVSIGVVSLIPDVGSTPEDAILQAEKALVEAQGQKGAKESFEKSVDDKMDEKNG